MYLHNLFYVVNKRLLSKICIYYFPRSLETNSWIQVWLKTNKMKVQWTREIQRNKEKVKSANQKTQNSKGSRTFRCIVLTGRSVKAIPVNTQKLESVNSISIEGLYGKRVLAIFGRTWTSLTKLEISHAGLFTCAKHCPVFFSIGFCFIVEI